ncbi:mannose-6-phosphate isomerase, class I [Jeotgalibaca porci]|uniref:mannose-6-phosphate isomerase, class I n=1 Tax=Jeotgalibaca porci TaxID=1868793 RepID=UPI0016B067A2|nr:mannose-6-phosphate isomerase, class I [Lactobacillales bacterium]
MIQPLFMQPVLQEKMWGGTKLRDIYGYSIPSDHTGECWAISAHPDGVGKIAIGTFAGMGLDELYQAHPELFGNPSSPVFPLLTKIIDAADALSVQVHPDDAYGMEHEGELGKTECWYIIDADEGAEIIYGHNALSKEEFAEMVKEGKWSDLLRYVPVKRGDFFFVPSGTIHAIGAGITILETQQSSNTTYRVYDFDRVEQNGQKRDLHIQESIDVTAFPHVDAVNHFKVDGMVTTFIESDYFNVYKWDITESFTYRQTAAYTLVSVLEGEGVLEVAGDSYAIMKGMHFVLPNGIADVRLDGNFEMLVSTPGPKSL